MQWVFEPVVVSADYKLINYDVIIWWVTNIQEGSLKPGSVSFAILTQSGVTKQTREKDLYGKLVG